MIGLLDPRIWLIALAILGVSSAGSYFKGRSDGQKLQIAAQAAATVKANEESHRLETRRQDMVDEAAKSAAAREARRVADIARVSGERDGLQHDLAIARERGSQSLDACREHAATLETVFGQCVGRLEDVARDADGHASDSLLLQQSWPK